MEQVNTKGQQIELQIVRSALFFQEMRSRRAYRRPHGGRLSAQQSTIAMRSPPNAAVGCQKTHKMPPLITPSLAFFDTGMQ
jgi:hypothetical protein